MSVVVCIGAAAVDVKARPYQPIPLGSNTDGHITISTGGVCLVMARNLAQFGAQAHLLTLVGEDAFGNLIIRDAQSSGVHTGAVERMPGHPTATYAAVLSTSGNSEYAVFDGEIISLISPEHLRRYTALIASADLIIANANLPPDSLAYLAEFTASRQIPFFMNISAATLAGRLRPILGNVSLLGVNHQEAAFLLGYEITAQNAVQAAKDLLTQGAKEVIITLGPSGIIYCGPEASLQLPAYPARVVDTTGAGDALCSAFLYFRLSGYGIQESLECGLTAAALTIESESTVCPDLSSAQILRRSAPNIPAS